MLLVIDAGNTNIVFAVHNGEEWLGTWRLATSPQRTSDEYGVWLEALLNRSGIASTQIHRAHGCSGGLVSPAPFVPGMVYGRTPGGKSLA
jgi:pantothenate kinase type III